MDDPTAGSSPSTAGDDVSLLRARRLKLVDQITASGQAGTGGVWVTYSFAAGNRPRAYGVDIDGVVYPLGGQPPVAVSQGWGIVPRRWRSGP